jgi:glucose uptake protein GlcU
MKLALSSSLMAVLFFKAVDDCYQFIVLEIKISKFFAGFVLTCFPQSEILTYEQPKTFKYNYGACQKGF